MKNNKEINKILEQQYKEQRRIQLEAGIDKPVTLAISPLYRTGYCRGFELAKEMVLNLLEIMKKRNNK